MKDPTSLLRTATRRAKSDVANKLISMFLHDLSRSISKGWKIRVDGKEYEDLVRNCFENRCPYCLCNLAKTTPVIEHLDGMNRYRAGLHVPGNVLVACRKCNGEKRRDDQMKILVLATSGWASFLSHEGSSCASNCKTCLYWESVWRDEAERTERLRENLQRIREFRSQFSEFLLAQSVLVETLPMMLTKLYSDCQLFAETEIKSLLENLTLVSNFSIERPEVKASSIASLIPGA
ncbi:MAG: HNH endonuclease signature motif containing protein [Terracidiphilus sp.]